MEKIKAGIETIKAWFTSLSKRDATMLAIGFVAGVLIA